RLGEGRDRLAVRQPQPGDLLRRELRDSLARDRLVVMHDDGAVRRGVHIQLHSVGAELRRGAERGERVLDLTRRRAAVRHHERPHLSRLSAFFASIQLGSFSMPCTVWWCSGWGRTVFKYAAYFSGSSIGWPSTEYR